MNFDQEDLKKLAGTLLTSGAPIIASIVGGPIAGAAVSAIISQLAPVFGLAPDAAPAVVEAAIAADPNASTKLATIEDAQKTALAWAQLQVGQNTEELNVTGPLPIKFFYSAWRPAMGWISGPVLVSYQILASAAHLPMIAPELLAWIAPIWVGLAGLRTYERYQGVAIDNLPNRPRGK